MRIILKIFEKFFVMCGVAAVALFFFVILTGIYHNRADILSYFLEKPKFSPTLIPTKYPTLQPTITQIVQNNVQGVQTQIISNQIDCIGPDNKQFKTTLKECEDLNRKWGNEPDYMVNCQIHVKCGGGTIYLKKSECDKTYCCFYPDGRNVFYRDKSQCTNSNISSNQNSLIDCTVNGKTFKATANECIDAKNLKQSIDDFQRDLNTQKYSDCITKAFSNYNSCTSNCSGNTSYANEACAASYLGSQPLIENSQQKYDECVAEARSINENCW